MQTHKIPQVVVELKTQSGKCFASCRLLNPIEVSWSSRSFGSPPFGRSSGILLSCSPATPVSLLWPVIRLQIAACIFLGGVRLGIHWKIYSSNNYIVA